MINNSIKYVILTAIMFVQLSFIQKKEDNIPWSKDRKLTWKDFQGKPNMGSRNAAMTDSGYGFNSGTYANDSLPLTIENNFSKKGSWVKVKEENDVLLAHEQCHFDITELFTRKVRKQLLSAKFTVKTFNKVSSDLFKKSTDEWRAFQDKYDKETNHSKIIEKQLEWEKKVAKELEEYESYNQANIKVYLKR